MKKAEKYIYLVLGIILIVVIACGITYMIATNNNKTETKEETNNNDNNEQDVEEPILEDGVTLKDTYEENNTIIQEYEIILNGKEENLKITYTYSYDTELICHSVKGRLNNIILYDYNLRDTYNEETGTVTPKYTKEELLNINKINLLI